MKPMSWSASPKGTVRTAEVDRSSGVNSHRRVFVSYKREDINNWRECVSDQISSRRDIEIASQQRDGKIFISFMFISIFRALIDGLLSKTVPCGLDLSPVIIGRRGSGKSSFLSLRNCQKYYKDFKLHRDAPSQLDLAWKFVSDNISKDLDLDAVMDVSRDKSTVYEMILAIISNSGIRYFVDDIPLNKAVAILERSQDRRSICVDHSIHNNRKAFDVCHEVGHLLLEHTGVFSDDISGKNLYEQEEQADDFARSLLLVVNYILVIARVKFSKFNSSGDAIYEDFVDFDNQNCDESSERTSQSRRSRSYKFSDFNDIDECNRSTSVGAEKV